MRLLESPFDEDLRCSVRPEPDGGASPVLYLGGDPTSLVSRRQPSDALYGDVMCVDPRYAIFKANSSVRQSGSGHMTSSAQRRYNNVGSVPSPQARGSPGPAVLLGATTPLGDAAPTLAAPTQVPGPANPKSPNGQSELKSTTHVG